MRYVIQDDWQVSAIQCELMPAILELSPPYNLPRVKLEDQIQ